MSHGPLPTNLLRNAWFSRGVGRALRGLRGKVDVTVANGAVTLVAADVNAVHFVHGGWMASPYYDPGRGLRGLYQRLYTWVNARAELVAFRRARRIVAVSEQVAGEIANLGIARDKIVSIPNGVDTVAFNPDGQGQPDPALPGAPPRALFVGDLMSRRKGLDIVLSAMHRVDGFNLIVVGRTEGSPYPGEVKAAGLEDRVFFTGFRRDIPEIMRACDMFVFPSRYEACSLVLLEALASGLPVITCHTTGGSELMGDSESIKLADPDDIGGLEAGLRALIENPSRRQEMSRNARKRAEQLDWQTMGARYAELLCDMPRH